MKMAVCSVWNLADSNWSKSLSYVKSFGGMMRTKKKKGIEQCKVQVVDHKICFIFLMKKYKLVILVIDTDLF